VFLFDDQAMDELDIGDFKYGGVNLTGFTMINPSSARYLTAQRQWTRRNPNYWLGARRKLTVDTQYLFQHG